MLRVREPFLQFAALQSQGRFRGHKAPLPGWYIPVSNRLLGLSTWRSLLRTRRASDVLDPSFGSAVRAGIWVISFSISQYSRFYVDRALPLKGIDLFTLTTTPHCIAPTYYTRLFQYIKGIRLYSAFRTENSKKRRSQPYRMTVVICGPYVAT